MKVLEKGKSLPKDNLLKKIKKQTKQKKLVKIKKLEKPKENKDFRSIETLFRNSLRSNLELTTLADSKASILISVNGFILTVILTASGLYLNNPNMIYPFITIMLTSLISILLGTMAIRPRDKAQLIQKEHIVNFKSIAYFQDMAETLPDEYFQKVRNILENKKDVHEHIIKHIHILGSEIKVKYYWLKIAYTSFAVGLTLSAILMIIAIFKSIEITPQINQFNTIYEPSGAVALNDGKVLLIEDESEHSLHLIDINDKGKVKELNRPKMSRKTEVAFKREIRDLEGITSNNSNQIYAITSHTTNKSHKHKVAREQIVRFNYKDGEISQPNLYHGLLDSLKTLHPKLNSISKKRKKEVNIEALTWDKEENALLMGLRSPLIEDKAVVISLKNPNEIFDENQKPKLDKPILLDLYGDGIRGMSWDEKKQGYWIIAGSVGKRKDSFSLWFWDKKNNKISVSKHTDIGYAEGITTINNMGIFIVKDDGSVKTHGANYTIIKD